MKTLKDYLTPKEVAKPLGVSYTVTLELLGRKLLKAEKVNGKWHIKPSQLETFKQNNLKAIEKLKAEYVSLYWQGLNPPQLEAHVSEDFKQRHIIADKKGFATNAIMESLPKRKEAGK